MEPDCAVFLLEPDYPNCSLVLNWIGPGLILYRLNYIISPLEKHFHFSLNLQKIKIIMHFRFSNDFTGFLSLFRNPTTFNSVVINQSINHINLFCAQLERLHITNNTEIQHQEIIIILLLLSYLSSYHEKAINALYELA